MKNIFNSITAKVVFIAILTLLMLIPNGMIRGLIEERQGRQVVAVKEVSQKWGLAQEITGPVMVLPYTVRWNQKEGENLVEKQRTEYGFMLPEGLDYQAKIIPEVRKRGVYEVPVYNLDLAVKADFDPADLGVLADKEIQWDNVFVSFGIPDTRGIKNYEPALVNNKKQELMPGVGAGSFLEKVDRPEKEYTNLDWRVRDQIRKFEQGGNRFSGIHFELPEGWQKQERLDLSFNVQLMGSESLYFWPMGKNTTAKIVSSWPSPGFDGYFLPESNDNNDTFDDGFEANWNMSYFGRSFRQNWLSQDNQNQFSAMTGSKFGVKLINTVDFYQKNERAVKYAILFIGLMFLAFFCFEILGLGRKLHPLQYLLVGCAMSVFYLLVLAFSEVIGFDLAYWGAAAATVGLVTLYCSFVLQARQKVLFVAGLMVFIYGYLYTLLQLETYALMIGSVFTFLVLAGIMWVTRKIDWYNLADQN